MDVGVGAGTSASVGVDEGEVRQVWGSGYIENLMCSLVGIASVG